MKSFKCGLLWGLGAMTISQASANLVVNGDFSQGNTGFSSDYVSDANDGIGGAPNANPPTTGGGDGAYSILTDPYGPTPVQNPFGGVSYGAVPPSIYMMAVNGAENPNLKAWYENISGLIVGQKYLFSFYLSNWSFAPVANINLNIGLGDQVVSGIYAPSTAGVWEQENVFWTANSTSAQFAISDLQTAPNGNDFALDNISLTAVPEPATMAAGAMLLVPFGLSVLRIVRRNRMA